MYNHNKAQQSSNRVHISWDILYVDPRDKVKIVSLLSYLYHGHPFTSQAAYMLKQGRVVSSGVVFTLYGQVPPYTVIHLSQHLLSTMPLCATA